MPSISLQIAIVWVISLIATRFFWNKSSTFYSQVVLSGTSWWSLLFNDTLSYQSSIPRHYDVENDQQYSTSSSTSSSTIVLGDRMKGTGTTTLLEFYPNPLGITPDMRAKFHPVVKINQDCVSVLDLSQESGQSHLIPKEDQESFIQNRNREERFNQSKQENCYTIGKYDENRVKLYSSELFQDSLNSISGYDGARTLHVGVDLGGPVGENVHSFWDGVVHSVGYNSELGDYGYVVIVEYDLSEVKWNLKQDENHPESDCGIHDETRQCGDEDTRNTSDGSSSGVVSCQSADCNRFWALYGHLDASTMDLNTVGKRIQRGDVLGHIGDVHENGGWSIPHVHFQLTLHPPVTHDLPGAVTMKDRERALVDFPDPRFILGEIY